MCLYGFEVNDEILKTAVLEESEKRAIRCTPGRGRVKRGICTVAALDLGIPQLWVSFDEKFGRGRRSPNSSTEDIFYFTVYLGPEWDMPLCCPAKNLIDKVKEEIGISVEPRWIPL